MSIFKIKVLDVKFDTDGDKKLAKNLKEKFVGQVLSIEAEDENEAEDQAIEHMTNETGFCIFGANIDVLEKV